ncbi:MAG TPA: hypothetical protein PLP39_06615, partial [Flavobacterium lutivivi]|nr:hypothetical protein [Flavobacterium lutivivi]
MKIRTLLLLFLFTSVVVNAQNLLTNPGFESGASVGYATTGAGYTYLSSPYSGSTVAGNYAVTNYPSSVNTTDFIFEGDHTTGIGKMLIIDGNTTSGNPRFWSAGASGAGISGLTIGTTYTFSYWIKSVSNLVTDPTTQANIDIQITGGNSVTLVSGATLAPLPAMSWRHVVYSFVATASTVNIELWNTNTNSVGNDFALDDLVLTDDLIATCNVVNAACVTANDGALTVAGIGGTLPYVNYSITGPVTQNNATGVFTNLPPGTYTVTVTDSSLSTAQTATLNNIVVGPALTASPNSSICIGNSFNLNVSGSSSGYTWTASPADPSLTTPNIANPTVTPTTTTTYTVSSTIGACAPITKNVIITVNLLPTVSVAVPNQTICPGNTATIALTGTPNSNVTIVNDLGITYVANIGPAGTGTFVTPILQTTRVYTIVSVKNFFTQCETTGLSIIMTITVVPNGCATVKTEPAPGTPPLDLTLCTSGECRTLQANVSDVPSTTTYSVSSIPYCPYPFTGPTYNVVPITSGDDFWSPLVNLPFSFCFYGQNYNSCTIGTNGLITFRPVTAGGFCDWPDTSVAMASVINQSQSIFGVFQDTDMSVPPTAPDGSVNWKLEGTYPCRKLIVNFYNLGQWNSTASNPGLQTSQIVLYEVSNIIEVFVERRVAGTPWSGTGLIGVIGNSGAQSLAAPGRDAGNWSATNEAWRFTPTGPNVPVNITWLNGATVVGTGPTVTVCPTTTTTYTLQAQYQVCGVPQTATSTVTLNVNPDLTQEPVDLTQCSNVYDLTYNLGQVLGSLDPSEYEITFHHSQLDAETLNDEITNPSTYVGVNGETIYMAIYLPSFGCTVVKSFQLFLNNCNPTPTTPPDLELCESSYGVGT